jgi:hypothetical protein
MMQDKFKRDKYNPGDNSKMLSSNSKTFHSQHQSNFSNTSTKQNIVLRVHFKHKNSNKIILVPDPSASVEDIIFFSGTVKEPMHRIRMNYRN